MAHKLAINGGEKTVTTNSKHYQWPIITDATRAAVLAQLDESISIYDRSGIIESLENKLAEYHNKKFALLTNSGTSALHSMYVGANLDPESEVICPAYTFYATVTPLFFTGAIPVLADCGADGNIDPKEIERKITSRTKAVVITHMWGLPCDMKPILDMADKHKLMLFEDGSHAHGATYNSRKVGSFGHASAFSLQAQKTLMGGEGGFLVTDNEELFYKGLLLGHYNKRCRKEIPSTHPLYQFAVTGMGLKLRIHPLAAAIANEQFNTLEEVLAGRREIAKVIADGLEGLPGIILPHRDNDERSSSWYAFVVQYNKEQLKGLSIEKVYNALIAEGCTELDRPNSTAPLNYHPLFQNPEHLFRDYKNKVGYQPGDFPNAEMFYNRALKLPVWHNPNDLALVHEYLKAFRKVIENYEELL
ncbi:MAG: DegT/DnrJ/EryC1/StrS family aminotransferase [Nanoarchaeota archaeon]